MGPNLVDPRRATPPSQQLVEGVLDRIAGGTWGAGAKLPSVRGLAADALVNPNTVGKAYRELEVLGAVEGRNGSGMFVTPAGPRIAKRLRRQATLRALEHAMQAALAAGHEPADLRRALSKQIEQQVAAHDQEVSTS